MDRATPTKASVLVCPPERSALNRTQRRLKRMQPLHAFGVGLLEHFLAQCDQHSAVTQSFNFDIGGIFRARSEIGGQISDPTEHWIQRPPKFCLQRKGNRWKVHVKWKH